MTTFKDECLSTSNDDVDCGNQFCGFWNESFLLWSDVGCTSTYITEEMIKCQCNHLTNFAALFVSDRVTYGRPMLATEAHPAYFKGGGGGVV